MLPLLQLAGDGAEHKLAEATETLADYIGLSAAERAALTPDGRRLKFHYRVQYALTCLRKAGLLAARLDGAEPSHNTSNGKKILSNLRVENCL